MKLDELTARFWINHEDEKLRNSHHFTFPLMRLGVMLMLFAIIINYLSTAVIFLSYMITISIFGYIYSIKNLKARKIFARYEAVISVITIILANIINMILGQWSIVKFGMFIFLSSGFVQYVIFHGVMYGSFPKHIDGMPVWKESLIRMWFGMYFLSIINNIHKDRNIIARINKKLDNPPCNSEMERSSDTHNLLDNKIKIFKAEIGNLIYS